jgi:small GTP-binding protein
MLHGNSDASSVNAAYEAAKHKILEVRATWETTLNLDGIGLVSLPPDIGKCTYLENLSISNNLLTSLPSEIGECKLLRHLDLSNNKLTNLPSEIARCSNLRNVLLPGNRFTALPTPLTKCKNLEQIDLSGNEIETLSPLIGQCTSLKQLSVSGNLLVSLPAEIGSCKRLRFINLESNRLSDLPVELRQLDDLSSLRLHLNDALGLPREILGPYSTTARSAPPKSILDYYFSRLKQGSRPLNEVKLLLVGRGATGKTSVSRALRKLHYKEKLGETQGIEIQPWDILCGEDRIKVHLWDFAGQEITHETHRFFLTQRSVYLVVLDGRGGQQMEEAEYWLSHVEKYGGDESPVIVVLNKWKTDGPYEIEQRRLQREFPHIRAFIQTDCAAKHGLIDLEETLQSVVDSMKSVRQTWPATWDDVRRELEHMVTKEHCNFLKWDDYKKICADRRVTEPQEQESLAIVLHELGFALYYGNNEQLRDTRVLNPNWAANGLYGLVRGVQRRPRPGHPGEFFVNDLPEILQEGTKAMNPERGANFSDYEGQDVQQFLVDLMVDRELGFLAGQVRGRDLYLLPGLLTLDEPDPTTYDITAHIEMAVVRFRFVYDLLPSGVMSRFIVRTHPLSEDYYRWQRGVVLGWGGSEVLGNG